MIADASHLMTPAWIKLRRHEKQQQLWRTKARFVAVDCGRGSGKSMLSQRRVVRYLHIRRPWPNPRYFYLLPTYNQARRVGWKNLKGLVPPRWIRRISESDLEIETVFGSTLYVFGMDKPSRFEGLQYDGGIADESCDQRVGVFNRSVMPALGERHGWCWRIGVPKRFGPAAREFHECCLEWETKGDGFARFSWPSSDIMTPAEIATAMSMMDQRDFNEQYNASWESVAGRVYYAFDENSRRRWDYRPDLPIIVGSDFNVTPMAWVLMQMHEKRLYAFDEVWLRNTNTPATLNELHQRYSQHTAGWYFIGDPAARQRKTSATVTDYMHIKNDARFRNAKVWYAESHPLVMDRVACVNWALRSAAGERALFVDDRKCLHLIRDLEYLAYQEGSRDIDDRDPDAGHITDALGYVIHLVKPMRLENSNTIDQVLAF